MSSYNSDHGLLQVSFSDLGGATNTSAAMVVGTGASLSVSGTGTIGATSVPWSGLSAATAALTIANGTNATTFNQTSGAAWTWANTTAATSSVPQNSPIHAFNGKWWGFPTPSSATAGSVTDSYSLQNFTGGTLFTTTISNVVETSGVVTLTVSGNTLTAGNWITLAGLTTATWLNGLNVVLNTANATSLVFNDPTNHANQTSAAETGSVAESSSTLSFEHTGAPLATFQFQNMDVALQSNFAGTSTSINASYPLLLQANYWTGSASALDQWAILQQLGSGTNAKSTLQIGHSGSTGAAAISVQSSIVLQFSTDTGISRDSAGAFDFGNGTLNDITGTLVFGRTAITQPANSGDVIKAKRNTDTSPAGNFIDMQSNAGASLFAVDITGTATSYAGATLTSLGIPSELAKADPVLQAAAITATTLLTPGHTGRYRVSCYLQTVTAATTSSTLGPVTITFTDGTNAQVAQSIVMPLTNSAGAIATSSTANSITVPLHGDIFIYALTGVAIQYAVGYATSGTTTMKYDLHLIIEAM